MPTAFASGLYHAYDCFINIGYICTRARLHPYRSQLGCTRLTDANQGMFPIAKQHATVLPLDTTPAHVLRVYAFVYPVSAEHGSSVPGSGFGDGGKQSQRIVREKETSRKRREEYEVDISDPQDRGHWAEGIGGELLSPRAGGGG